MSCIQRVFYSRHMLPCLISRDHKQITRYSASGMECRGTCTIFLMQRIPYFPIQSWPWCLTKGMLSKIGQVQRLYRRRGCPRGISRVQIPEVTPLFFAASLVPRIRPILYPLCKRNHHGRYDFRDGRHWPKFGTNRSNKDIFHLAFNIKASPAVNHPCSSWILHHYCFHKDYDTLNFILISILYLHLIFTTSKYYSL